jgi:hypothetical protein
VLMEPRHVGFELRLGNGEPVGIPAIPSHWGRGREVCGCLCGSPGKNDQKSRNGKVVVNVFLPWSHTR